MAVVLADAHVRRLNDFMTRDGYTVRQGIFFNVPLMAGGGDTYSTAGENVDARRYFTRIDRVTITQKDNLGAGLAYDVGNANFNTGQFLVEINRDPPDAGAAQSNLAETSNAVDLSADRCDIEIWGLVD